MMKGGEEGVGKEGGEREISICMHTHVHTPQYVSIYPTISWASDLQCLFSTCSLESSNWSRLISP